MTEVDLPPDRVIARQGEIGTGFFIVVSGAVRVVRDGETIAELGPGQFFGELSVIDRQPRVAQVISFGTDDLPGPRELGLRGRHRRAAERRHGHPARACRAGCASSTAELSEARHH